MHRIVRLTAALVLTGGAGAVWAQSGSLDPVFKTIPFDRWIEERDQARIHWTARVLPVELSSHQRLQVNVELQVAGDELVRRRGKGVFVMLVQFSDNGNRVYQTHEAIDLQLVKEDTGKTNISYSQRAFVTPGDYSVALAVFDTATGEHSAQRLPLHVRALKNDPLPDSWHDLPPVEILKAAGSPDDLFLPNITGRLHLPLETHRPVRVEILVNASPLSASEPSRTEQINNRSLASLIPALKVLSHAEVRNGTLNVALLDLTTQQVIFQQDAVHDLDWPKLGLALKQAASNSIDVHALQNRRQDAQFFVAQVRRRIEGGVSKAPAEPLPVLIVLSGPMAFGSGADLQPIELGVKPDAEVFYVRYHSLPPRPVASPLVDGPRRGRRAPLAQPSVATVTMSATEPVDSLERTLKPLQPHLFDVYEPDQFRRALGNLVDEISRL